MIHYIGSNKGSKLFIDNFNNKCVVIHVNSKGEVVVEASNITVMNEYVKSGKIDILLKHLYDEGIKSAIFAI